MIKKIRSSLFAKVFIITSMMLLCISLLVFGLLAWLMPQTYSNKLNTFLDRQTQEFISELEKVTFSDSGGLFDQFIQNMEINSVELYDTTGMLITLPSEQFYDSYGANVAQESDDDLDEGNPVLSSNYYFSFLGSNDRYMLIVYGKAGQIAELQQSFLRIFPLLLIVVLAVSLVVSWLYSRIITKPVLEISRVSEKMSDLHLEWQVNGQRTDELGILGKSLNRLSQNLRAALTDLKKANAELEADIKREKALEQAQLDFFSAASHELKTPITIIKGQLEGMLLGIGAYKDREKYLLRSLGVTQTLESMVYDLLTISRLQTSDSDFKTGNLDCVPLIRKYLSDTEDLIVDKDLQINTHFSKPITVNANKILMEKVFSNLIGNAVKYSPPKAIINITVQKQQSNYLFSIENYDTHIPEEAIPKLFEAFYRVDTSRSRQTGGSGLGLYIVQKILQQHNSHCNVRNTENGVEFFFKLPQII
ncbi:HAMP domain-containing sensor histidine kinase [Oscillospiraceae bacterium 21-37]